MTLSTLDPVPALVVVDLQRGIASRDTAPHAVTDVVARSAALADAFRERGLPVVLVRVSIDGAGFSPGRSDRGRTVGTPPAGWDEIVDELAASTATDGVLVCPCGFVADHLEVLYDLDIEARQRAEAQGLVFDRTTSLNTDPHVFGALADLVVAMS